jgi:hypothetical protein
LLHAAMRVPQGRLSLYHDALCHTQSILVHYVFATHERRPLVSDELQPKLWAYMGGIARTNDSAVPFGFAQGRLCGTLRDLIVYPAFRSRSMPGYFQPRLRRWWLPAYPHESCRQTMLLIQQHLS